MAKPKPVGKHALSNALRQDPQVGGGEHGWWQACPKLGVSSYDAFGRLRANLSLRIGTVVDPVSSTPLHRSYLHEIRRALPPEAPT
jgi:hypothetical protein